MSKMPVRLGPLLMSARTSAASARGDFCYVDRTQYLLNQYWHVRFADCSRACSGFGVWGFAVSRFWEIAASVAGVLITITWVANDCFQGPKTSFRIVMVPMKQLRASALRACPRPKRLNSLCLTRRSQLHTCTAEKGLALGAPDK